MVARMNAEAGRLVIELVFVDTSPMTVSPYRHPCTGSTKTPRYHRLSPAWVAAGKSKNIEGVNLWPTTKR
jgi:hypothetical protein